MTYKEDENYCTCSPDKLFNVNFNYACYLHDRQYRNEVKIRKTRKQADQDLRRMIIDKFKKVGKKKRGYVVGYIYYYGVRLLGGWTWVK